METNLLNQLQESNIKLMEVYQMLEDAKISLALKPLEKLINENDRVIKLNTI